MITYEDLQVNQRCVYQAFTQLKAAKDKKLSGSDMGKIVNDKGYDADDDMAVSILADYFKMTQGYGGTGAWFIDEVRFEENTELIASINVGNDAKALFTKFGNAQAMSGDILYYSSKNLSDAEGHVIYGQTDYRKADVKNQKNLTWSDVQHQRDKGPYNGDYIVYYEVKS